MASDPVGAEDPSIVERQRWLAVLARAGAADLTDRLAFLPPLPTYTLLRRPEIGLVMVCGRQGGDGQPFNLGEMTVTRCTVRVGAVGAEWIGHAYLAGRDTARAELAARLDAGLQDPAWHTLIAARVIEPLAAAQLERVRRGARQAAATRVVFDALTTMR